MNDIYIYKHKAEKYKYKYLKLKQELEGGEYLYNSCITSPPINFNDETFKKLTIVEDYPKNNTININSFNNKDFVGRLIKSKKYGSEYLLEYTNSNKNYEIIESLQNSKMLDHIPEIVYACTIKNNKSYFSTSSTYNALKKIYPYCTEATKSTKYGYIITTNVGESIANYILISDLIEFIEYLIIAINNFIIPLHKGNYVLNNIDLHNIYWNKDKQKVFFNISKMIYNTDISEDIKSLINSIKKINVIQKIERINSKLNDSILNADNLIKILRNIKSELILEKKEEEEKEEKNKQKKEIVKTLMEQYDRNNGLTGMITIQAAKDAISNLRGNPGYISEEEYNTKIQNIVNKTMEQKKNDLRVEHEQSIINSMKRF